MGCCSPASLHHTTFPRKRNRRQHSAWYKSATAKAGAKENLLDTSMEVAVLLRASGLLGGAFRVLVVMAFFRVLVG